MSEDASDAVQRMTPNSCKAARALLTWTAEDLAEHCDISASTVNNYEAFRKVAFGWPKSYIKMQAALEANGITFVDCGVLLAADKFKVFADRARAYQTAQPTRRDPDKPLSRLSLRTALIGLLGTPKTVEQLLAELPLRFAPSRPVVQTTLSWLHRQGIVAKVGKKSKTWQLVKKESL